METNNNNIYIKSVEGSEVFEHMNRGKEFYGKYVGMIPYSLQQIHLLDIGMKTFDSKRFNKTMSDDIINLKFKQKIKSNTEIIKILSKKINNGAIDNIRLLENINKLNIELDYKKINDIIDENTGEIIEKGLITILTENGFNEDSINNIKILAHIKELETKKDWKEIKVDDIEDKETGEIITEGLRTILYKEGFTITEIVDKKDKETGKVMVDKETGEILTEPKLIKYVAFARSSAKSRTGQVLFVKEGKLHDKMIKWMRLGMNLEGATDVDFPALLSYESLVGSSLEDVVTIPVDNILIVSDVKSIFKIDCNVVAKNSNGILESVLTPNYDMESDIFDGEGLLESSYFTGDRTGKGFILGRQFMFKSALYNCNIQLFLRAHCPEGQDFDTWEIENIFGETMLASEIHCIITPNSLKALKFSNKKGSKPKMWNHWKSLVKKENNIFGICKSEKESHRGSDENGNILNQTSYQMLNSMPYSHDDMEELSKFERDYIEQLKNNNDVYVEFLTKEANNMNCNEMLVNLYKHNNDIVGIKTFKDKRKKDIHNYVAHAKKGKLRLKGDYCTIIQNGREFLYHAIGQLPVNNKGILDLDAWESHMILKGNQVYTTLHEFGREFVGFRNPHTSPSNVLIIENTNSQFIKDYFNLTDNIIYTNAIDFPINRILSGQDVDSDNLVVFDSIKMLQIARECYIQSETSNYKVCENGVPQTPNTYKVCNSDMAKVDGILSKSQKFIGTVVNLGAQYMSTYWDSINKGETDTDKQETLLAGVDICTVLSEISIDMAKRLYSVDIKTQIENLEKCEYLKEKKPLFFKYISKSKNIEDNSEEYETSMDYLYEILNKIEDAEGIDTVQIEDFLESTDDKKIKDRQVNGIVKAINDMSTSIKHIEGKYKGTSDSDKEERYIALDSTRNEHLQIVGRYKIKTATVIVIINKIFRDRLNCKYKTDLLNTLYVKSPIEFINAFKMKKL